LDRARVLDHLAQEAALAAVELVSVAVVEPSTQAQPSLESWRARLVLRGDYAGTKRVLRDLSARHPGLTWLDLQWRRVEAQANTPSAAGVAAGVELQAQLVALRWPAAHDVAANAANAAVGGGSP
jgi:hypothetical protein